MENIFRDSFYYLKIQFSFNFNFNSSKIKKKGRREKNNKLVPSRSSYDRSFHNKYIIDDSRRKFDDSLRSFMLKHLNTEFRVFIVYEFLIVTMLDIDFDYNIVKLVYEDVAKVQLCIVMRRSYIIII